MVLLENSVPCLELLRLNSFSETSKLTLADLEMETWRMTAQTEPQEKAMPDGVRAELIPVARRVFWWGAADRWIDDLVRFVAQVMTYGNLDDVRITLRLLGDKAFIDVLKAPPPGVFDIKSWTFWHARYRLPLPPLPARKL